MCHFTSTPTAEDAPLYVWAAVGTPDNPPDRIKVEVCLTCAALVPTERFDRHGQWHARLR